MSDKEFTFLGLTGIALVIGALLYMSSSQNANAATPSNLLPATPSSLVDQGLPVPYDSPMDSIYNANPEAYTPTTPADLTINVPNGALNLLSNQYQPLFGFVGVADTGMYN